MADEINRASPRTQSALLQAMQERHVTVAGARYDLPQPFHVLATQNPLEQEGTYPLPEAQLDRFLLQIDVGYPDLDAERRMLLATTFGEESMPERGLHAGRSDARRSRSCAACRSARRWSRRSCSWCARRGPTTTGRKDVRDAIAWGPGPRASQAFMLAVRARALLEGRLAPSTDDVVALAQPVLRHRMALNFSGARRRRDDRQSVIERLCRSFFERRKRATLQHEAEALGAGLPPLMVEAERLAAAVSLGVHGRRKAGMGESFWQFRRYPRRGSVHRHRLAAIGQVAASVRARARMGSGAVGVVLARRARPACDSRPAR